MELPNIFSKIGCGALSDGIDFANGIKKAGPVALRIGTMAALSLTVLKLYQYATGKNKQISPNCVKWDSKGITLFPKKTEKLVVIPQKGKDEKIDFTFFRVTRSPLVTASDALIYTAMLGIASVATYTLTNALQKAFQTSSNYFGCKA